MSVGFDSNLNQVSSRYSLITIAAYIRLVVAPLCPIHPAGDGRPLVPHMRVAGAVSGLPESARYTVSRALSAIVHLEEDSGLHLLADVYKS